MATISRRNWGKIKGGVLINCQQCGRVVSLGSHKIGNDGNVKPGFVCGYDDCGYKDNIRLERWKG